MMIKHVHILLWQYFIWKYARYPFSFLFKWSIDLWVAVRLSFGRCIIHILWWMILWSLPFSHSRSSVIIKPQFEKFISLYNMANIFHLYICVCVCVCVHVCEVKMRKNENDGENKRKRAVEWNWTPAIDLVPASFITLYGPVLSHWVGHTNKPFLISRQPPTPRPSRAKGSLELTATTLNHIIC